MMEPIKLDEFGLAVWRHRTNKVLFVMCSYEWCDRVIVLDETKGCRVIDDTRFTTFDFTDWIPMTKEEYARVKSNFKEIYEDATAVTP